MTNEELKVLVDCFNMMTKSYLDMLERVDLPTEAIIWKTRVQTTFSVLFEQLIKELEQSKGGLTDEREIRNTYMR